MGIKKVCSKLFFYGGSSGFERECMSISDEAFFELMNEEIKSPRPRMDPKEVNQWMNPLNKINKKRLTRNQKLVKSVLEKAEVSRAISEADFENLQQMREFRHKYSTYLRIKRLIPLCLVAPFTGTELNKMALAAAIGSKSVCLTLPGLIGFSLPAFFFCHMASYYAPDKLKGICQLGKYTLGAPFWFASTITDGLSAAGEEKIFGEEVPIDINNTGGTIPSDLGDVEELKKVLREMKEMVGQTLEESSKKTY